MARKPCIVRRCREYAAEGCSRCLAHQRDWEAGRWSRGSTSKRGSRPGWRGLRRRVVQEQRFRCARCPAHIVLRPDPNRPEGGVGFDLHHIDGDATNDARENVEALCRRCHRNLS